MKDLGLKYSFLFLWVQLMIIPFLAAQSNTENLFYLVDTYDSFKSLKQNVKHISIVSPQTFHISMEGVISGTINKEILRIAKENDVKVMPLFINDGFTRSLLHDLLNNPEARKRSIDMMLEYAKIYQMDGWQFDLEGLHISDRENFTSYYQETALVLHKNNLKLSAAVVHNVSKVAGPTAYHGFLYEDWRAGYDLKELSNVGDFLSIMSYSQHKRRTPPGPIAGYDWVEQILEFIIEEGVPPNKISLGISTYSGYWFADFNNELRGFSNSRSVKQKEIPFILAKHNARLKWDENAKCNYAVWSNDGVYEYLFVDDGDSVRYKLSLLNRYNLRGISVWVLGSESSDFWSVLKNF